MSLITVWDSFLGIGSGTDTTPDSGTTVADSNSAGPSGLVSDHVALDGSQIDEYAFSVGSATESTAGSGATGSWDSPTSAYNANGDASAVDYAQTFNPINILTGQGVIHKGQANPIKTSLTNQASKIAQKAKDEAASLADSLKKPFGELMGEIKWGLVIIAVFFGFVLYTIAKQTKITRLA